MTSPFPQINPGQVIMDPGLGGTIAQGLAQVLSQQQQQKENEYRQQQLMIAQQQQASLQQYYAGQIANEAARTSAETTRAAAESRARGEVGGAMRQYLTPQASPTAVPGQPQPGQPSGAGAFSDILQGGAAALAPAQGNPDVFGKVSDENLPDAVHAIQGLQPKEPELPTAGKEFMFAQELAKIDPKMAKFFVDNWVNKPGVTVNNLPGKVETAYGVEGAKADVTEREKAVDLATQAAASFPSMHEAYRLLGTGKAITGMGAKQVLGMTRILATMGVDKAQLKAADTQTLTKLLRDGVLTQLQTRALGSGTAVSDADRNYMESVQGADLTLEPEAIKRIVRINVGLGIERMNSAKLLLQQQLQDHPEAGGVLNGKIKVIDTKLQPIWKQYQEMLADEAKRQAQGRMNVGVMADSLFPAR